AARGRAGGRGPRDAPVGVAPSRAPGRSARMSIGGVKGKVGDWKLEWQSAPRGRSGQGFVKVDGGTAIEVRWRRDDDGIWIELPDGVYGFDVSGAAGDDGLLAYDLARRFGSDRYDGLSFLRAGEEQ